MIHILWYIWSIFCLVWLAWWVASLLFLWYKICHGFYYDDDDLLMNFFSLGGWAVSILFEDCFERMPFVNRPVPYEKKRRAAQDALCKLSLTTEDIETIDWESIEEELKHYALIGRLRK